MDVVSASVKIWWTNFPSGRIYRGPFFPWTFFRGPFFPGRYFLNSSWLTQGGQFTCKVVTCQPHIENRVGKVRQPKTDIVTTEPRHQPLCRYRKNSVKKLSQGHFT